MGIYQQWILGPNGADKVGCTADSMEEAVEGAVRMAILSKWQPPLWWQFWKPKWPADCIEEYHRQT